jgi:predicted porin
MKVCMKFKKLVLTATAAAAALVASGAHAQVTVEQLQQALAQAQKAAADAQAAANAAMEALAKVQAVQTQQMAQAQAAQQSAAASNVTSGEGAGFTFKSGANSITLYGLIDATVSNRTNANAAGKSVTGYQDAWFSGNRWGLTGKRDLGGADGLKAIFRLESEFNYRDGVNPDSPSLFNRDAWVGLESDSIGKLTFGRQNTLARDFSQNYGDPYGSAQTTLEEGGWTNNNNFKQMIFYAGSATGTRYNDGLVWKKKMGSVVAGLGYQFGGIPGDSSMGSTKTGALAYNAGMFNVSGFVNSANVAGLTHQSYSVGGNVQPNDLIRVNLGYFGYKADQVAAANGQRKDTAYTISTKITPPGKMDYEVGYQSMRASNAVVNGSGYVYNAFGNAAAAKGVTVSGNRNTLYGSAFYRYDKSTEFYLAVDSMKTTGGYLSASANGLKTQTGVGLGMRYKF